MTAETPTAAGTPAHSHAPSQQDPEKQPHPGLRVLSIETASGVRSVRMTRRHQVWLGIAAVLCVGWTALASAGFLVATLSGERDVADTAMVEAAYRDRIEDLQAALAQEKGLRAETGDRLQAALEEYTAEHAAAAAAATEMRELARVAEEMRLKLARALTERDAATAKVEALETALAAPEQPPTVPAAPAAGTGHAQTLAAVTDALQSAVRERDAQRESLIRLENELAAMDLRMQIAQDRQVRMVASLEDAVQTSFAPLEAMFERAGLDVETLISEVRTSYTGFGGPNGGEPLALARLGNPSLDARLSDLIADLERMDTMRIAAARVPYTMPVRAAHRFTSGFGTRRDPRTGGRRAHNGIDLAGPRGTPILSTADGSVVFAGRQSGFGNLVRIRHAHGFETLYAHLNKIHVKVGDRIARGDHIGDMGTTGRSTGVHLHYEVRLHGKPVNPMIYIKAAKDVF
ncbi:MAG: DUF5930 domain-containing protein [Pseudomonadota bacterium]